jgi:hypothetical protein
MKINSTQSCGGIVTGVCSCGVRWCSVQKVCTVHIHGHCNVSWRAASARRVKVGVRLTSSFIGIKGFLLRHPHLSGTVRKSLFSFSPALISHVRLHRRSLDAWVSFLPSGANNALFLSKLSHLS